MGERRDVLAQLLRKERDGIRLSEHLEANHGPAFMTCPSLAPTPRQDSAATLCARSLDAPLS